MGGTARERFKKSFVCYLTWSLRMRNKGGAMLPNREHPLY